MLSGNKTDQIGKRLREISTDLKLYIEKRIELLVLNIGEPFSAFTAAFCQAISGAVFLVLGLCFVFLALAIYLGELVDNESLGYLLASLPLFTVGFLFIYLKPFGLFNSLEQRLESEVMKVAEKAGNRNPKKLQSHETATTTRSEE